ncbi:MAG: hypothetical protein KY453_12745, partial [Gemmatimonadetes bacterium]|nr:hypothetical protein [Gemmatimonadota bacterium]
MTSVLFVCLGNICRSPLAEGVFAHLVRERGLEDAYRVDSAGTGAYHVGDAPDRRSVDVARRNGVALEGRARQVAATDFREWDVVVAMDRENLRNLEALAERSGGGARLHLLRDFDPEPGHGEVPDPSSALGEHVNACWRELAGPAGGRLHTARSRNDQVATDVALFVREAAGRAAELVTDL